MVAKQQTVHINNKQLRSTIIKMGIMLGVGYTITLYLFFYGGRDVFFNGDFSSAIQLLTIASLYFGLIHCRKLFSTSKFLHLFLYAILILLIATVFKIITSALLYGVLAPNLGAAYEEEIIKNLQTISSGTQQPLFADKKILHSILSPLTIAITEGISLFFSGVFFSAFISLLLSMFRR